MYVLYLTVLAQTAEIQRLSHSGLDSIMPPKPELGTNTPGATRQRGHACLNLDFAFFIWVAGCVPRLIRQWGRVLSSFSKCLPGNPLAIQYSYYACMVPFVLMSRTGDRVLYYSANVPYCLRMCMSCSSVYYILSQFFG